MDEKQLNYEFLSIPGESHPGLTFEEYRDACVFLLFYHYLGLRFGDEVEEALLPYLDERAQILPEKGHENALFLSLQRKRMSVRSVENLVKKYAKIVTPLKKITPHKLRSTYGTSLYRETGDIYLVADVLGHSDVNTTKKHYAALEDERRRSARNKVQLREKRGK